MRLKVVREIVFMESEEIARLCRAFLLLPFQGRTLPFADVSFPKRSRPSMTAGAAHAA
jgi:hypothetical protein